MNNLDLYMPFHGHAWIQALKGYSSTVERAYLRAVWHYWSHEHCDGLRNDARYLQAVCECSDSDWPEVSAALFSREGFFKLIAGKWHQMRAMEEWKKSKAAYKAQSDAGKLGMQRRWGKRPQ